MADEGTTATTNGTNTERYARLLKLYNELEAEFDALEHQGLHIREEIQKAIDREKMKEVLQKIVRQPVQ